MALTNEVTYLIKLAADMSAANRGAESIKLLDEAYKKLGLTIDATDKITVKSAKAVGSGTSAYLQATVAVQKANGAINTTSFQAQKTAQGLQVLNTGLTTVAKSGQAVVSVHHSMISVFGDMFKRALIVAPAWMIVRTAIQAVTGTIADAIKFFNEFDEAIARIQISGNLTRAEVVKLSSDVLKLGQVYGFSFEEISKSTKNWVINGNNMSEVMLLVKNSMQLALLTGESLSRSTERMDTVMDTFNITAADSSRILDNIAVAMKANGSGAEDMIAGLEKIGPLATQANFSLEETLGIITAIQSITGRSGTRTADAFASVINRVTIDSAPQLQSISNGKVPFFEKNGEATTEITGQLRDLGDILKDTSDVWDSLTSAEQQSFAILAAGKRSTAEFYVLMNNFNKTMEMSIEQMLGTSKAQDSVNIATSTLRKNIERLKNDWHNLINNQDFVKLENFFINVARSIIGGGKNDLLDDQTQSAIDKQKSLIKVIELYAKIKEDLKEINKGIAEANANGDITLSEKRQSRKDSILNASLPGINNALKEIGISISAKSLDALEAVLQKTAPDIIDRIVQTDPILQSEKSKVIKDVDLESLYKQQSRSKSQSEKDFLSAKILETRIELTGRLIDVENKSNVRKEALKAELQKKINSELKETIKLTNELNAKQILDEVRQQEADQVSRGISSDQAKINAFFELDRRLRAAGKLDLKTGLPFDPTVEQSYTSDKRSVSDIVNRRNVDIEDLQIKETLAQLKSFGANQIEIQQRLVGLEEQRAYALAKSTGLQADMYKVEQARLKLAEMMNEQIASYANKLQSSFSGSLSDVLLGKSGPGDFLSNVSNTIRSTFAESASESITGGIFKSTGIGNLFGKLNFGLANIANPIANSHVQGISQGASIIVQAHKQGMSAGFSGITSAGKGFNVGFGRERSDNNQGFLSSLFSKLTNFTNPGIGGGIASAGLGALGGFGGGPFGGGVKGSIFGAVGGLASAINPLLGAGIGLLGGLFSLFRRPKKVTTVEEQTRDFQVSSRIDVTNNKLDIVNRNLVALKQSFDTYVLPESASFATKNSIEDNFSLAARRGLIR